ncbi:unnamed protein product [Fraxinus pennsylvanica]|uniref:Uncharacterized protein n=1 Tax=Fraxinus pennsylvanica TaxID=56036 RepID=A0AAD2A2J2_9LAMI|nr:unnamed protein product [Fraxinus pennsylvanica]
MFFCCSILGMEYGFLEGEGEGKRLRILHGGSGQRNMRDPIGKNVVEESLLQTMEEGPQVQEEEEIPIECELIDSDNEVNDDDFHYDKNASKHIKSGLHVDPVLELDVGGKEDKSSDELDCPTDHFIVDYLVGVLPKRYKVPSVEDLMQDKFAKDNVEFLGLEFLRDVIALL